MSRAIALRTFAGESFSPAPPFLPCAGLSFPVGCAPPTAAAPLGPHLSAGGGQLFTARFAGCGRGPSLRCVRLRRFCSLLPASALPNHAVLSHPLRGAYRAFESGCIALMKRYHRLVKFANGILFYRRKESKVASVCASSLA